MRSLAAGVVVLLLTASVAAQDAASAPVPAGATAGRRNLTRRN